MVTFRFYLVSLVAVFLALAMGVVVGSTLIDRAIVDRLDRSVETVRDRADRAQEENAELQEELARLREFGEETAPQLVAGTLEGSSVVVLAERGVDPEPVRDAVSLLAAAGAEAPGVLWLEPAWTLADDASVDALAESLDVPATDPVQLRRRAWQRVVGELQGASVSGEPLQDLADDGFLTYDGVADGSDLGDLAGLAEEAVVVTGPTSQLGGELTVQLASVLVDADVPAVVGEAWRDDDEGPARGTAVQTARDDDGLGQVVSTVDHLDLVEGRVALTRALAALERDEPAGHYGYGADAEDELPPAPDRPA